MQLVAISFGCSCPYLGILKDQTKTRLLNTTHSGIITNTISLLLFPPIIHTWSYYAVSTKQPSFLLAC